MSAKPWLLWLPLLFVGVVLLVRHEPPEASLHERIQQRLIEAELGSATRFHLAAGPRAAQLPSEVPLSGVLAKLESAWPEDRWAAAGEISARRDPRAVEYIIRAMQDPQDTVRVCLMASTLGYLRDPRALGPLTEAAFDPANRDLRLCAIESLGMLGDRRAVPDLVQALETRNMPVAAANALAQIGDARAVAPLITAAADPHLALWMVTALGELGAGEALPWLHAQSEIAEQKDDLQQAIQEATWKINRLSAPDASASLAGTLLGDSDTGHRAWAAFRLGEGCHLAAVTALLQALVDADQGVRERSAAALIRIGEPAHAAVRAYSEQTGEAQSFAVAVLGYIGKPSDLDYLRTLGASHPTTLATTAAQSAVFINRFHTVAGGRRGICNR